MGALLGLSRGMCFQTDLLAGNETPVAGAKAWGQLSTALWEGAGLGVRDPALLCQARLLSPTPLPVLL